VSSKILEVSVEEFKVWSEGTSKREGSGIVELDRIFKIVIVKKE